MVLAFAFKKVEGFEEVMIGGDVAFTVNLRCIQPEAKGIDPVVDLAM